MRATRPTGPSYDPAAEVVELCRELIRIDTTNYGDDDGPGERKAAEYVADAARRGRDREPSSTSPSRAAPPWSPAGAAATDDRRCCCTATSTSCPPPPTDWQVDPFSGEIQDGYVWGRGAVDMKDFDAMLLSVVRARAARRRGCPTGRSCSASPPTRRPAATRAPRCSSSSTAEELEDCTEAVGEVGGFTATVRGTPDLPDRGRREGHGLDAADRPRPRRARLDDQPRQRGHRARRRGRPDRRPRVAGAADARRWRCCSRPSASSPAPRPRPENAEALVEEFGERRADARRGHPQHHQPDDARAPATRST